ncbi:MAG: hypothetical protein QM758_05505 [Armatimonas sp.]
MLLKTGQIRRQWLTDVLRLFLAFALLPYGISKLTNTQFPHDLRFFEDATERLHGQSLQHLDGLSVFLLFFSFSRPYQILTGLIEILAACLLLWRKTWPLGAITYLMVMTNVLLVDLCYSVWLNGTLMAGVMMAGILLLVGLERLRFLGSIRALLTDPAEKGQTVEDATVLGNTSPKHPSWRYWLQVTIIALIVLFAVMLSLEFLADKLTKI